MDTIAINANATNSEEGQGKKNFKVSDKAKVAMATGAAGLAAGAGVKAMADALGGDSDEGQTSVTGEQDVQQGATAAETISAEDVVTEVNPDDVMLEEPVAEPIAESVADTDIIAEAQPQPSEGSEYQPFANSDPIGDDVLPEPQPEEVLIAENTGTDVVVGEDSTVDLICGVSEEESEITEETVYPEEDLYAGNPATYDDYDVQSDLMA